MTSPSTQFVTYADQVTGVAYANPSQSAVMVTFTAKDATGAASASATVPLAAQAHTSQTVGALLGLASFQGSLTITASAPIVSLSLNFEAAPVFSSLPPGQADNLFGTGPATYYFPHIASAGMWRTTFTYVNASSQMVTCKTSFLSETGSPLPLPFNGSAVSSTSDAIAPGGIARRQTDSQPLAPVMTGWAVASCRGPVKASALFRSYNVSVPTGEASVIAAPSVASRFITYADQITGAAYANPSASPAVIILR